MTNREKKKGGAVCLACAHDKARLLPSATTTSRASRALGRRCASAPRRANSCTTTPASCRRPGTRKGRGRGRHPTPGAPACGHEQKQKRKFGRKERLNVRSTAQKKKNKICNFTKMSRGGLCPLPFLINSKKKLIPSYYRHYGCNQFEKQLNLHHAFL